MCLVPLYDLMLFVVLQLCGQSQSFGMVCGSVRYFGPCSVVWEILQYHMSGQRGQVLSSLALAVSG